MLPTDERRRQERREFEVSMDPLDQFAEEAARFEAWACSSKSEGALAAHEALVRITSLYLAGLQLPPAWTDELEGQPDVERVPDSENDRVVVWRNIPLDMYGEVFNPLLVPPEEPVIGSIADDVVDIYRDVVAGLRAYRSGNRAGAQWEWAFLFSHHWGEHATGALRALHAWLMENSE